MDEVTQQTEAWIAKAMALLDRDFIPAAAERLRAGRSGKSRAEEFTATLQEIRAINARRKSIEDAVAEEEARLATDADPRSSKRARDRVYQRFHRALVVIWEEIVIASEAKRFSWDLMVALKLVIDETLRMGDRRPGRGSRGSAGKGQP